MRRSNGVTPLAGVRLVGIRLIHIVILLVLLVVLGGCGGQTPVSPTKVHGVVEGFVTRACGQLLLNGRTFRFAGANMQWLGIDDSTAYASPFRINDGFKSAQAMGATVVRGLTLGISTGCGNCIEPTRGVFNERALRQDDYAIKTAREYGLRLVIPLTDNWHYPMGGKHNFTAWRGITDEQQFYSNKQVIADFEAYIHTLLTRVNTYTGIAYKDDPTILAWETGNELDPPTSWTQAISTYIKSVDSHHLVVDGRSGVDPNAAQLSNVDMVSDHYYPKNIFRLTQDASAAKHSGKPLYVGEFDWNDANGGDSLSSFLATIEAKTAIAGDAYWELWPRNEHGGYVTSQREYMLHYPGDSPAMRKSVQLLHMHAYKMRGMAVPETGTAEARPKRVATGLVPVVHVLDFGSCPHWMHTASWLKVSLRCLSLREIIPLTFLITKRSRLSQTSSTFIYMHIEKCTSI